MSDPFADTNACVERLVSEYGRHRRLIIAVDFDDTVFDYHKRGSRYDRVFDLLRRCQQKAFYIVLYTASDPSTYVRLSAYMADQGIHVHTINENPIPLPFGHHGKPYYNILLDDRAGLGQACETLEQLLDWIESEKVCAVSSAVERVPYKH